MPIARDEVIWAYRMFLDREPEHEAVIAGHMLLPDRAALRRGFMTSAEFARANPIDENLWVGRFQDVRNDPVEVDCPPALRAAMVEHIASEWRRYGAEAPHWSVLTNNDFTPDNIGANIDAFYASGRDHASAMLNPFRRAGVPVDAIERAMDFGCGVGRLTLGLAPLVREIVGVDISPPHLELARERGRSVANATFVAIDAIDDLVTLGRYDLIVSFMALQHNPPPVMADILRKLVGCLSDGGCILIQMPTYIDGYAFDAERYMADPVAGISANPLPQHVIFDIFRQGGCEMIEVREDLFLGGAALSHTFAARKR